jgi:hypothetical protein
MTPQEKAKELVEKFKTPVKPDESYSDYNVNYLACALIAVDEIINGYEFDILYIEHKRIMDNINFWDEVKQEIINL